ncbi:hypothetical protein E4U21_006606 [Claviceps maximensis]|nr:hypothetical protein E4U21_006606 [Claviceps maximensis]
MKQATESDVGTLRPSQEGSSVVPADDAAVERRVVRKMDRNLLALLVFLFLLAFLDRSNIGNARIAGMQHDLHLSSEEYEWLLTIFYIAYIVFEPLIMMHKIMPARVWMTILVAGWGISATAQAAVQSWSGLMACRFFLAFFETGFCPGVIYLLSFFYLRTEIGLRIAIFFSAAPLGTCFAGALAYAITSGSSSLAGWRLLLLVEGLPVLVMAVVTYFAMTNSPSEAWFLTEDEKRVALARQVRQVGKTKRVGMMNWGEIVRTLLDVKPWLTAFMYFSCNVSYSSLPVYLPTILKDMGFSGLSAQGLSAPPYFAAFVVTIITSFLADRSRQRGLFVIGLALLGATGYLMLAIARTTSARYAGVFLATMGVFPTISNILPWVLNNQGSDERRGASIVLLNLIGQCGPLLGTRSYPQSDGPNYVRGHSTAAAFMVFVALLAAILRTILVLENKKLDKKYGLASNGNSSENASDNASQEEQAVENYGPNFRHVL